MTDKKNNQKNRERATAERKRVAVANKRKRELAAAERKRVA